MRASPPHLEVLALRRSTPSHRPTRTSRLAGLLAGLLLAGAFPAATSAIPAPNVSPGVQVSAGLMLTCAMREDGTVWCWGSNAIGQLGNGDDTVPESDVPVQVVGISTATQIGVGDNHACALLADTSVTCWGVAAHEDGSYSATWTPIPVQNGVGGTFTGAVQLALGGGGACVRMADGSVACWGAFNDSGQLGTDAGAGTAVPVPVAGISGAVDIALGQSHSCAALDTGEVKCWGINGKGQLGQGVYDPATSADPLTVLGLGGDSPHAVKVAAGRDHSCALLADATMVCWGGNFAGRLGDGTGQDRLTPTKVVELADVVSIDAGDQVTCAIRNDGTAWCWGYNNQGEVGSGKPYWPMIPAQVVGITSGMNITAGWAQTCAVVSGGQVRCWGVGQYGVTGDNTLTNHFSPTAVWQFPPLTTKAVPSLRAGAPLAGTAAPVTVAWVTGDGSGLGVAGYGVAASLNGGAFGTPETSLTPSIATTAPTTGTVAWRAYATDLGGFSRAGTTGDTTTVRLVQQGSAAFTGTWSLVGGAAYSGSSAMWSKAAKATATFKTTARSFSLVATRGKTMGKLAVYVDGKLAATVDCYRATTQYRSVVWAKTFASSGAHTIKVMVLGTAGRPRVELDALVTLK